MIETVLLEIIVVILVSIEIVELYFNMRAVRVHEKELNDHCKKLEAYDKKVDTFMNLVNQLDEHIKTLDKLLTKKE